MHRPTADLRAQARVNHRATVGHPKVLQDGHVPDFHVDFDTHERDAEGRHGATPLERILGDAHQSLPGQRLCGVNGQGVQIGWQLLATVLPPRAMARCAAWARLKPWEGSLEVDALVGHLELLDRPAKLPGGDSCSFRLASIAAT